MKKKQAIAFLLSTAMTTGTVIPAFGASNDISGHWAEATITRWQNDGKIGGYEDGTFKPDKTITRAEFVRLLNTATTTSFTSNANINFSDVKESDWFFGDVAKAVGSGVTSGFEDGTFRPSETVTRAQAAVFICKAKGLSLNETRANLFADASDIPAWAKGAVGAAVNAGYLSGYPDGTFGANKGMTRAEAVSTLDRLSGAVNEQAEPNQGVSTPSEKDDRNNEETYTTAKAGDMVWTSGGSGGGRRSSSSSSGSSSSSSSTVSGAVTIRSQSDANDYKGKTLTGKATIYAKDGLELQDIRFKGDVDIIADSTATAAAYIDNSTAVAAAYFSNINIYFEGRTNISGTITVIRDGVPSSTQVVIITRTPRAINAVVKALTPTKIVGFEVPKVEANAPVEIAKDAKVATITADDGASVVADGEVNNVNVVGKVDNIELNGTGSTGVTVNDGAKVEKIDVNGNVNADVKVKGNAEVKNVAVSDNANAAVKVNDTATVSNVAVSDSASAAVEVKDTAKVEKVDISDTAIAKVDVAPEAKVDTVTSTSTAEGSEVTGSGEVGKIESANSGTLTKGEEVTTPVEVPSEDTNQTETPTDVAVTGITLNKTELSLSVGNSETLTATVTPDNATNKTVTWTSSDETKVTVENGKVTAVAVTETNKPVTITAKAGDKTATCTVTVTPATQTPETPTKPADPVKTKFTLEKDGEKGETTGEYKLISTGTGKYQYALANSATAPEVNSDAWKDVTNTGTTFTVTDGTITHVHIRAVGGTAPDLLYSENTIALELSAAVEPKPVTDVTLDETTLSLKVGESKPLKATVAPDNATNKAVIWTSDKPEVATVDASGEVTAVAAGTATITVKSAANESKTATCTVTVTTGDTNAAPVVTDVTAEKATTTDTTVTVTGLTATAGRTLQYYAAAEEKNADQLAALKDTDWTDMPTATANGSYSIKGVADTNNVIYFRYKAVAADGETAAVPASAASAAVNITTAAPKLTATVSGTDVDLDNNGEVTVTVSDPNSSITQASLQSATATLSFTAEGGGEATESLTSEKVTFEINSTAKTITIKFKPTKKTAAAGFEAGKTYTLKSGSVSSGNKKLFDIKPDEDNITFTTKADDGTITTKASLDDSNSAGVTVGATSGDIVLNLDADLSAVKEDTGDMKAKVVFEAETATASDGSNKVTKEFTNCTVTPKDDTSKKGKITITLAEGNTFEVADKYTLKSVEISGNKTGTTVTVTADGFTLKVNKAALSVKASINDTNKEYDVSSAVNKEIVISLDKASGNDAIPSIDANAKYEVVFTSTDNNNVTINSEDSGVTFKYDSSQNTITITGAADKFTKTGNKVDYTLSKVQITNAASIVTATIDETNKTLSVTTAEASGDDENSDDAEIIEALSLDEEQQYNDNEEEILQEDDDNKEETKTSVEDSEEDTEENTEE